jgi:hypothetical protein
MCDCETREVYTISVDSNYASDPNSNASFVAYLNTPLRNVVRAELLSASIPDTANVNYIHVSELVTKFNDHAPLQYTISSAGASSNAGAVTQLQSNLSYISEAFAVVHQPTVSGRKYFHKQGDYEASAVYRDPIRTLDKLTVNIFNGLGELPTLNSTTYLLFRFECAKNNKCLY